MDNNTLCVVDFVKNYKKLTNEKLKMDYIKKVVKRTYCPIIEKRMILQLMLDKSIVEEKVSYIDMMINKLNFYAAIISLYTYIVPDKDEEGKPKSYEMYDLLMENNLVNPIFELIGERELGELTSINGLLMDNWHTQHLSTEVYISNLLETASRKFGVYIGAGLEKMADALGDEVKMQRATDLLDKVFKTIK